MTLLPKQAMASQEPSELNETMECQSVHLKDETETVTKQQRLVAQLIAFRIKTKKTVGSISWLSQRGVVHSTNTSPKEKSLVKRHPRQQAVRVVWPSTQACLPRADRPQRGRAWTGTASEQAYDVHNTHNHVLSMTSRSGLAN